MEDLSHRNPTLFKDSSFVFTLRISLRYYTAASLNFQRMQASKKTKSAVLTDTIHELLFSSQRRQIIYHLEGRNISYGLYLCIVIFDLLFWMTRIAICYCPVLAYVRKPLLSTKIYLIDPTLH